MDLITVAPLIRMAERVLIVLGGILSTYLGYLLFAIGIDKPQGSASALGIELKNFGPGLFFAGLGAVILVTTMRAAIRVGAGGEAGATAPQPDSATSTDSPRLFFGVEDPTALGSTSLRDLAHAAVSESLDILLLVGARSSEWTTSIDQASFTGGMEVQVEECLREELDKKEWKRLPRFLTSLGAAADEDAARAAVDHVKSRSSVDTLCMQHESILTLHLLPQPLAMLRRLFLCPCYACEPSTRLQ